MRDVTTVGGAVPRHDATHSRGSRIAQSSEPSQTVSQDLEGQPGRSCDHKSDKMKESVKTWRATRRILAPVLSPRPNLDGRLLTIPDLRSGTRWLASCLTVPGLASSGC